MLHPFCGGRQPSKTGKLTCGGIFGGLRLHPPTPIFGAVGAYNP